MQRNEPNEQFRRNVRGFYAWLGSVLIAAAGPIVASMLIESGGELARVSAVAIGTLAWVPMAWVITSIVRRGDEFQRRLHLVALAVAFGCGLMVLSALDWLARADFVKPPPLSVLWLLLALLWFAAILAVKWYFERET